jgi:hypothetical protein
MHHCDFFVKSTVKFIRLKLRVHLKRRERKAQVS